MKALIIISAISFILTSASLAGPDSIYNEFEPAVNDIPFNTEIIASTTADHDLFVKLWDLDEESYVADIPFNTGQIVLENTKNSTPFDLEEEAYIDDIPFNTELIASNAMVDRLDDEEMAVEDFPFDSWAIYNEVMTERMSEEYALENDANDIPFSTELIASNTLVDNTLLNEYTAEASVDDFPFNSMDLFLASTYDDYFNECAVNDIPFDTEEIFCANVCCEKNKRKLRFERNISMVQTSYSGATSSEKISIIEIDNMGGILNSIANFWITDKLSFK